MYLDKKDKILVIAAHPDDEILGCGGTIAKLKKKGNEIRVFFAAEGITARYLKKDFNTLKVKREIETRNLQSIQALKILGINKKYISFGNRRCCRLDQIPLIDLVKDIENKLDEIKPNVIFTHWHNDLNIDHKIVNQAVCVAIRPINRSYIKEILCFEILSSTEWNTKSAFNPNCFFDITKFIFKKCSAFSKFKKEIKPWPHSRSKEVIKSLAIFRGSQVGLKYAEGFSLIKRIIK